MKAETDRKMLDDIDMILSGNPRPEILPKPLPMYANENSRIPERMRVSFSDGSTAIYQLYADQPAPVILENIKIIRKWKQGYVNKPQRRRRNKT